MTARACPISTGRGTRRVHLVREGVGVGSARRGAGRAAALLGAVAPAPGNGPTGNNRAILGNKVIRDNRAILSNRTIRDKRANRSGCEGVAPRG